MEFTVGNFGEKWLTDVTEMKYGVSSKAYLSAILDLGDKSIVSFVIGHSNNNALVFEIFDIAHEQHPDAKSIFHSDILQKHLRKSWTMQGCPKVCPECPAVLTVAQWKRSGEC